MKPKPLSEKQFMAQVVQLARLCGWLVYHTYDSRRCVAGFPDLVLCHPGRSVVIFAELKRDSKKRPTPEQQRWLSALATTGNLATCWTPADWESIQATLQGRSTHA